MTVADDIVALVSKRADLTEAQLSEKLFGGDGYQQRVNSTCRRLLKQGQLTRHGKGGISDPFTYSIAGKRNA